MEHVRFILAGCLIASFGFAQGAFQNLYFDNATIITNAQRFVAASNALPGWTVLDNFSGNNIFYNDLALGSPCVSIHDRNSPFGLPLQLPYSILLQSDTLPFGAGLRRGGVSQIGTVPADAQSIQFYAIGEPLVTFSGYTVSLTPLRPATNIALVGGTPGSPILRTNYYTIYGGDISSFAGQTGELSVRAPNQFGSYGYSYFDTIYFSPQAVPEPSTWALVALGSALFCCLARFIKSN